MKTLTAILISFLAVTGVIDNIATVNRLKKEAEEAYKAKDYSTAINNYHLLLDSLQIDDENIRMNLAHAYLMSGDTAAAQRNYSSMIRSNDAQIRSLAFQQLGVVTSGKKQYQEALSLFKESLKANPANNESRYNYELVKKLLQEQQQQQNQNQQQKQDQQNKEDQQQQQQQQQNQQQQKQQGEDQQEQQNQDGEQSEQQQQEQQTDQQGQEGEQKPEQPQEQNMKEGEQQNEGEKNDDEQSVSPVADKLKEMNISEEKARMILEAMRNNEMQYIQQNRRKPTQARDRSKPDW